ncbi:MAG: ZIP family metal transporter [Candidatus Pacearchaeota archaeon]|nr:ZIP family metal transporter [Candidatus Pacearchaeota archaeon]
MEVIFWILLMTFVNGLIALTGAVTLFFSKKFMSKAILILVSFAIGGLLGGAIFHFLPEAIEELSFVYVGVLMFVGIGIFYGSEKFFHWRHCHKGGQCDVHPVTNLILIGDSIHNFIDGVVIASSFLISIPFGVVSSLLIMAHELPQELGDFGVLVYGGLSKKKALFYNFLSQLTAVIGGLLGYFYLQATEYAVYLLPVAAGGFFYIAIADLIPEVFKEKSVKKRLINILAIVVGFFILVSAKVFVG